MLTKVIIKNFGSIKDEVSFKVNKNITTLVGKNESGKSTILKAVEKLNGGSILQDEKNVLLRNEETYIIGHYILEKEEIDFINEEYDKNHSFGLYRFPDEFDSLYYSKKIDDSDTIYYNLYYMMKDEKTKEYVSVSLSDTFKDNIISKISVLLDNIKTDEATDFLKVINDLSEDEIKESIKNLSIEDMELKRVLDEISDEIHPNFWIEMLPKYKFILFSSFKDVLDDNINFSDLNNNVQASNILRIAKIDLEKLKIAFDSHDGIELENMQTEYKDIVSSKFKKIFHQTDEIFKLRVRFEDGKIIFLTQDKTSGSKVIPLSYRSDGFKWYLSLYLTLYDYLEKVDDYKYIFLLDEPNLYLHPGAQNNLIHDVLYNDFSDVQTIYSTHSPYMIDINNNFSVRIVEKTDSTKVYNLIDYPMIEDSKSLDTLTPLLTALGLSISNDILLDNNDKLFIVEGIQDVYVLKAMINKLTYSRKMKNIKFISSTGASNVPFVYSYLFGMGYNTFTLVDNDTAGRNAISKIIDNAVDEELFDNFFTYGIIDNNKSTLLLEDIFSDTDRTKYLPEKNTIYYKRLYDNIDSYDFDSETINNFKKLFDILISK